MNKLLLPSSLDNKSAGRQSVSSAKPGLESDTDSMAEYGDGDTGMSKSMCIVLYMYSIPNGCLLHIYLHTSVHIYTKLFVLILNFCFFAFMLKMSSAGAHKVIQTLPTLTEHIDEASSSVGVKK